MLLNFSIQIAKCSVVKNIFNVNTRGLEKLILSLNIKKNLLLFTSNWTKPTKNLGESLNLTCLLRKPLPSVSAKSQIWNIRGKKESISIYFNKNRLKDKLNPCNL